MDSPLGGVTLLPPEIIETTARGEQSFDGAVLDDRARVEEQHPVGMPDAGQPVSDDHPGPRPRVRGERVDHGGLVLGVQRAGRLVDQQDRGRLEQRPRDADPLALAAGQRRPGLADHRLGSAGQPAGEFVDPGQRDGAAELSLLGGGVTGGDVLSDGSVEQVGMLEHHAARRAAGLGVERRDVDTVDQDAAADRLVQAGDQGQIVLLPDPDGPTIAVVVPGRSAKLTPSSTGVARAVVAEGDIVEFDQRRLVVAATGSAPGGDDRRAEHRADPVERRRGCFPAPGPTH